MNQAGGGGGGGESEDMITGVTERERGLDFRGSRFEEDLHLIYYM